MRSEPESAYRVRSHRLGFTVTYACPEARVALREMRRARAQGYPEVRVYDRHGAPVTEAALLMNVGTGVAAASSASLRV